VLSTTNGAVNTYTIRRLPYDPLKDFAPIGFIADTAYILVVPPRTRRATYAACWTLPANAPASSPTATATPPPTSLPPPWPAWPA
jgi:tripartite-type tricarboxylate transporter receptor subunit TctC